MAIFTVSSAAELSAAMSAAGGGDEIRLASGDYGDFSFSGKDFGSGVTITSSDPSNPATFNTIRLSSVENVTIDGVFVDFTPDEDTLDHHAALKVTNSSDITIVNSVFDGGPSVTDGEYIGRGIWFQDTDNITISENEVYNFRRGILTSDADYVEISYNYVHDNRTTTLSGGDVDNLTIIGNHLSSSHPVNFGGSGDHGDFIHYWTMPDQDGASQNYVIKDNFLEQGDGTALLGIYLDNNSNPQGFEDVLIENNVIHNGNGQGMRLEDVDGVLIKNNTLVQTEGDYRKAPRIRLEDGTKNAVLEDNIVANTTAGKALNDIAGNNITETGTLIAQYDDPDAPNYVGDLFVNGTVRDGDVDDFQVVSGSAADGKGATLTSNQIAGGDDTSGSSGDDTSGSSGDDTSGSSGDDTSGSSGDDTSGSSGDDTSGSSGDDTSGSSGDDTSGSSGDDVDDQSSLPVIDDFELDIAALSGTKALKGDTYVEGGSLHFDGQKDYVKLGRLEEFEDSEQLSFSVDFSRATADGSEMRLIWNHKKVGFALDDDGFALTVATADEGFKRFDIDHIGLNDTEKHNAIVILDAEADRLQVLIDGEVILDETETDLDFVGAGGREWGWSIGTGWNRYVDGEVDDFSLEASADFVDDVPVGSQEIWIDDTLIV